MYSFAINKNYSNIEMDNNYNNSYNIMSLLYDIEKFLSSIGINSNGLYYINHNSFGIINNELLMCDNILLSKEKNRFCFYIKFNNSKIFFSLKDFKLHFNYNDFPEVITSSLKDKSKIKNLAKNIYKELSIKDILE
jgi:hypothetical protein